MTNPSALTIYSLGLVIRTRVADLVILTRLDNVEEDELERGGGEVG